MLLFGETNDAAGFWCAQLGFIGGYSSTSQEKLIDGMAQVQVVNSGTRHEGRTVGL